MVNFGETKYTLIFSQLTSFTLSDLLKISLYKRINSDLRSSAAFKYA